MNERFKELMVQAIRECRPDDMDNGAKDKTLQRFAELIVRECTLQVADVRIENNFEPVGDAVLVRVLAGIKKHFGVEE